MTSMSTSTAEISGADSSISDSGIVLHHLDNSRSQRILWLLEELQVPYTIKKYKRVDGLAPAELKAIHAFGKSPVITDGKRVIAESGVIVDYIINKFGRSGGYILDDEDDKLAVNYFSHMAEGSLMPPLVMTRLFGAIHSNSPWLIKPITSTINKKVLDGYINPTLIPMFELIEFTLAKQNAAGHDFFVGNHLTSADFMMLFPLEAATGRASQFLGPQTLQWLDHIHKRPAYQRALVQGGEYAYAKPQAAAL